jgi:5-methylcytosine-specific restriction endonuclease McrA
MKSYSLSHLSDHTLMRDLAALVAQDRVTTAELLAHIAEVDTRQLYRPAAYPSMFAYCVGELRLSEDAAFKRIKAARAARRFPAVFDAIAEGRLHLSALVLLAPHLTEDTADELLAAATHQSKCEIERLLAERYPRPDTLAWLGAIPASSAPGSAHQQAPGPVDDQLAPGRVGEDASQDPGPVEKLSPGNVPGHHAPGRGWDRSRVTPLAPHRFAVQFTLSQRANDQLRYAQALLGHQLPSGDIAAVFERALDALIPRLEQRKFAATARPRNARPQPGHPRSTGSPRHIPADVKRTVWERDQGRCTFVSETGRRCPARKLLEFDHIEPAARGGKATVSGIRLRCRAHNQYTAEGTFGAQFMRRKRLEAAEARAANRRAANEMRSTVAAAAATATRAQAEATEHSRAAGRGPGARTPAEAADHAERAARAATPASAGEPASAAALASEQDVVPWLRALGFTAVEARRASALCEDIPNASLEERVRSALSFFHVKGTRVIRPVEDPRDGGVRPRAISSGASDAFPAHASVPAGSGG